jgi:hypothetical protein
MHHPYDPLLGSRILVVEPYYFMASELQKILQDSGAIVIGPVPTTMKALAILKDSNVDAVVFSAMLQGAGNEDDLASRLDDEGIPSLLIDASLFSLDHPLLQDRAWVPFPSCGRRVQQDVRKLLQMPFARPQR